MGCYVCGHGGRLEQEEFGDSLKSGGSDIEETSGKKPKSKNRQKTQAKDEGTDGDTNEGTSKVEGA